MKQEKLQELEFLKKCNHNDLEKMANCIIYGIGDSESRNKKPRIAEQLSRAKVYEENKEKSLPNAWKAIVDEYLRCGGSTIGNAIRKEGVSYREILTDICDRLGIYYNEKMPVSIIERNLVTYLMERCLVSDDNIVKKLYNDWCANQPLYQSGSDDLEKKISNILDYCFAKSVTEKDKKGEEKNIYPLKDKIMPFVVKELDKLVNTDAKEYKGWLNDIFKQVNTPSMNNPLGAFNLAAHSFNYIQGAAYDVTFPCTIYIIYMKIKNN